MLVDVLANVNPTGGCKHVGWRVVLFFISVYIHGLRLGCMVSTPYVKHGGVWLYAGLCLNYMFELVSVPLISGNDIICSFQYYSSFYSVIHSFHVRLQSIH